MRLFELFEAGPAHKLEYDSAYDFGEFHIQMPSNDKEAASMGHSLGAAGMDPFIETALQSNDPDIFYNALLDLKMIMPSIENQLMNDLNDERLVNMFMNDIKEIYHWVGGGYKKNLKFANGKWIDITYGNDDEYPEGRKPFNWGEPEPEDSRAYSHVTEKWDTKTKTPKSERGKYKGKTKAELKKMLSNVKKTGPHKKGSAEYERQNELEFAIRAKSDWGKVSESENEEQAITPEEVVALWKQVFPNSSAHAFKAFGGGSGFVFWLAKDKTEVANGIMDNDPLNYKAFIEPNGAWRETRHSLMVAPPAGSHLAYGIEKLRKKTLGRPTPEKLRKRFEEVKKFVASHADKLKNPGFDIKTKLGMSVNEAQVNEKAPPGMEDWIKDRKASFKKQYGDRWEEVLYATAWKQHNANESLEEAEDNTMDYDKFIQASQKDYMDNYGFADITAIVDYAKGALRTDAWVINMLKDEGISDVIGKVADDIGRGLTFNQFAKRRGTKKYVKEEETSPIKYKLLAQKIEDAVSMSYPDSDPFDRLMKYQDQIEEAGVDFMDALNTASKKYLGATDYHNYLGNVWDQYGANNPEYSPEENPWR